MKNALVKILLIVALVAFSMVLWASKGNTETVDTEIVETETICNEVETVTESEPTEKVDLKAMETEIYDRLYESFSEVEGWEVTREGNRIHISVVE